LEMRNALPELGVDARIGVNTGEVVTGTAERLATGDAVNVAARLEQAAVPGTILIGETTHELVRDVVEVESVEALVLKGKSAPLPALRLLSVTGEPERSHAARFVGREQELAALATPIRLGGLRVAKVRDGEGAGPRPDLRSSRRGAWAPQAKVCVR